MSGERSPTHADMQNSSPSLAEGESPPPTTFKPGFRVYAIIAGLGITNILAALENTVVSITAPVILKDLELGDDFICIINALFLAR